MFFDKKGFDFSKDKSVVSKGRPKFKSALSHTSQDWDFKNMSSLNVTLT